MFISTAAAATHEAVTKAVESGKEGGVFPPFDPSTFSSQLLWLAITFGFFYFFMARVVLPRIGNILEVRSDRISDDLVEAQRLKEETDAAIAAYEQELTEARQDAHAITLEASDKARAAADAERVKVENELALKLDEAEARVKSIRDAAMAQVNSIAGDTTKAIVARLTGDKISAAQLTSAIKSAAGKSG